MAGRNQKVFYIETSDLREKYCTSKERISAMCKAIGKFTQSQVNVTSMPRGGSIRFEIIGNRTETTKEHILKEMCQPQMLPKHGIILPNKLPKQRVKTGDTQLIRSTQRAQQIVSEKDHSEILKNGSGECYLLTEAALAKHNLLTGASELREFACGPCNFYWWKVVLITKRVSSCVKCKVKYDCLPRDKEFGIGRYICQNEACNNRTFYQHCHATQTVQCWNCNGLLSKPYIHHKFRRTRWTTTPLTGPYVPKKRVFNPSTPHDSTGSTIDTFLTQSVVSHLYVEGTDYGSDSGGDIFPPDDSDSSEVDTPSQSEDESESSMPPSDSESEGDHRRREVGTDSSSDNSTDDESSANTS